MKKLKELWEHRRWTLYLYYNGIKVAKIKSNDLEDIENKSYAVNVYFKKKLFGSNKAGVILRPIRLLKTEEHKKRTYWGTTFETGVEI